MHIRERTDDDLPRLVAIIAEQQPRTRYPVRWPLPFPAEDFVRRPGELGAWVAERDGEVVGHACAAHLERPGDEPSRDEAAAWARATGLPPDRLGSFSAFFVAADATGQGVGDALHDTAIAAIRRAGLLPVLDVVPRNAAALRLYRRKGWRTIGTAHPDWLPEDWEDVLLMSLPD